MHNTHFCFLRSGACIRTVVFFALVVVLLFSSFLASAQSPKIGVVGKVADSISNNVLAFATIRIFNVDDKSLVNGNISGEAGEFAIELPIGSYYAEIDFMGYNSYRSKSFALSRERPLHDVGLVQLTPSVNTLSEVVIQAEKSSMELSLDKKVFNVGQDLANAGGTANDILMNIPSVSVEPDGGIKLRGSSNVRILIDGKPSGLVSFKGGSGLQQLQASIIERVEIITNPSARYEAEGKAGIINNVLKKERNQGFNGSYEVITGPPIN
jgi:hypothetical protein